MVLLTEAGEQFLDQAVMVEGHRGSRATWTHLHRWPLSVSDISLRQLNVFFAWKCLEMQLHTWMGGFL